LPENHGGGGWIRTSEAFASDLQSDPFGHSGTPPNCGADIAVTREVCQVILLKITYLHSLGFEYLPASIDNFVEAARTISNYLACGKPDSQRI
jgi:hypothetical protein